jgi:transcriptional regulator with XRE-family HTH domain
VSTRERDTAAVSLFAAELAASRTAAGLSQDALGALINYSPSLVAMIESGRRAPTLDVARRVDEALKAPGTFVRLQQHVRTNPLPSWFLPYADVEAAATQLRSWQPSFVDGLLQTEDYARAVLSGRPNTAMDDVEALVVARMARQAVLDREEPPLLWAVLDEGALHRRIGDGTVMRAQLLHLAEMSTRPNICVEVVPYSAGPHYALLGAFAIAEADDTARVGYLETIIEGYLVEAPGVVAELMLAFDSVRAETLSRSASRDVIRKWADET